MGHLVYTYKGPLCFVRLILKTRRAYGRGCKAGFLPFVQSFEKYESAHKTWLLGQLILAKDIRPSTTKVKKLILDLCVQEKYILVGVNSIGTRKKRQLAKEESNWWSMTIPLKRNMILKIRQII